MSTISSCHKKHVFGFNWVNQIRSPPENSEHEVDSLLWNIGSFLPIGLWRAVLEINGKNSPLDSGEKNEIYCTPGLIYKLSKEWEVGLGVPVGLTNISDDYRVIGYLMWEFELHEK